MIATKVRMAKIGKMITANDDFDGVAALPSGSEWISNCSVSTMSE
jgi:hypothetical protein